MTKVHKNTVFLVEISWDGSGWIKGNIGQTGFYRVNYDKDTWTEIALQLDVNHKVIIIITFLG